MRPGAWLEWSRKGLGNEASNKFLRLRTACRDKREAAETEPPAGVTFELAQGETLGFDRTPDGILPRHSASIGYNPNGWPYED